MPTRFGIPALPALRTANKAHEIHYVCPTIFHADSPQLTEGLKSTARLQYGTVTNGWTWRGGLDRRQSLVVYRIGKGVVQVRVADGVGPFLQGFYSCAKVRVGQRRGPRAPMRATVAKFARRAGRMFRTVRAKQPTQIWT